MPISRAPTTPQPTPIPAFAPVVRPAFGAEDSVDTVFPLEAVAFVELIVELVSSIGVQWPAQLSDQVFEELLTVVVNISCCGVLAVLGPGAWAKDHDPVSEFQSTPTKAACRNARPRVYPPPARGGRQGKYCVGLDDIGASRVKLRSWNGTLIVKLDCCKFEARKVKLKNEGEVIIGP